MKRFPTLASVASQLQSKAENMNMVYWGFQLLTERKRYLHERTFIVVGTP